MCIRCYDSKHTGSYIRISRWSEALGVYVIVLVFVWVRACMHACVRKRMLVRACTCVHKHTLSPGMGDVRLIRHKQVSREIFAPIDGHFCIRRFAQAHATVKAHAFTGARIPTNSTELLTLSGMNFIPWLKTFRIAQGSRNFASIFPHATYALPSREMLGSGELASISYIRRAAWKLPLRRCSCATVYKDLPAASPFFVSWGFDFSGSGDGCGTHFPVDVGAASCRADFRCGSLEPKPGFVACRCNPNPTSLAPSFPTPFSEHATIPNK